jgi:hypothetical protein
MDKMTSAEISEIMGWNAAVTEAEARRDPDSLSARVFRVAELAAERAREAYERERMRHSVPASEGVKALIQALTDHRLTAEKADHIIRRDGYAITGVVMTRDDGHACLVNMSAVRWLNPGDLWNIMHTDSALNQRLINEAVAAEREACAMIVAQGHWKPAVRSALADRAAAIRARGRVIATVSVQPPAPAGDFKTSNNQQKSGK